MQNPLLIKQYIEKLFTAEDSDLVFARENTRRNNLPNIQVSFGVGQLLSLLVRLCGAKKVLEVGTFGGYSTIHIAKALPKDGKIISLELYPKHAAIALENLSHAGVDHKVEIIEGNALIHLQEMTKQKKFFDFVFIDADKKNYPNYLTCALLLTKKGSMIVCDNLIPKRGELGKPNEDDENAKAVHHCNQMLSSHPNLETIMLPVTIKNNGLVDALSISEVK